MPDIDASTIGRAIWVATAAATVVAALLAATIYFAHRRMQRSIRWRSADWIVTTLSLVAAYVVSGIVLISLIRSQLPQHATGDYFATSIIYVDPGWLQRLLPLVGIVATWFGLVVAFTRKWPRSNSA